MLVARRHSLARRVIAGAMMLAIAGSVTPGIAVAAPGSVMWWETKTPMPVAARQRAVGEIGGMLYLLGGVGIDQRVDVYDPSTDAWTTPGYTLDNSLQSVAAAVRNGIM